MDNNKTLTGMAADMLKDSFITLACCIVAGLLAVGAGLLVRMLWTAIGWWTVPTVIAVLYAAYALWLFISFQRISRPGK